MIQVLICQKILTWWNRHIRVLSFNRFYNKDEVVKVHKQKFVVCETALGYYDAVIYIKYQWKWKDIGEAAILEP